MKTSTKIMQGFACSITCALGLGLSLAQTMPASPQAPAMPPIPGAPSSPGMPPPPPGPMSPSLQGQPQPYRQVERDIVIRHHGQDMRGMPDMQGQHRVRMMHRPTIDPVQALKARLDRVTTDLHLKPEQEADWEALRKHLMARAQQASEQIKLKRAAMMQAPQPHAASRANPDRSATNNQIAAPNNQVISPDQALEQRAQRLRDQAKQLDQTAVLVKALYEKLSPEQRTIMRLHREQKPARMQAWQSMQTFMPAIPAGGPAERMKRGGILDDESQLLAGLP
ncbi:MAG: hypothetical protein ACO37Z_13155, partial [Burkholderiaceae bacterium]